MIVMVMKMIMMTINRFDTSALEERNRLTKKWNLRALLVIAIVVILGYIDNKEGWGMPCRIQRFHRGVFD